MPLHRCYGKLGARSVLLLDSQASFICQTRRQKSLDSFGELSCNLFNVASTKRKSDLRRSAHISVSEKQKLFSGRMNFVFYFFVFSAASPAHQEAPSMCSCVVVENVWSRKTCGAEWGTEERRTATGRNKTQGVLYTIRCYTSRNVCSFHI